MTEKIEQDKQKVINILLEEEGDAGFRDLDLSDPWLDKKADKILAFLAPAPEPINIFDNSLMGSEPAAPATGGPDKPDLESENNKLRYLLWLQHGCGSEFLYGDDGEMQCSNRKHVVSPFDFADFKRDSALLLEWKLGNEMCKQIMERPEK